MRRQYHLRPTEHGYDAWDVDRLIALTQGLPVDVVPLASIIEIDRDYWFEGSGDVATVRKVTEHARLIAEVDLSYPIILGPDGRVLDGMHRVARVLLNGGKAIDAVRLLALPEPDVRNCDPADLPYDRPPSPPARPRNPGRRGDG